MDIHSSRTGVLATSDIRSNFSLRMELSDHYPPHLSIGQMARELLMLLFTALF